MWKHVVSNHSANEGFRDGRTGKIMLYKGLWPGFPDITMYFPCGQYAGLHGEFKPTVGGVPTTLQLITLNMLSASNYYCEVLMGCEHAIDFCNRYKSLGYDEKMLDKLKFFKQKYDAETYRLLLIKEKRKAEKKLKKLREVNGNPINF